MTRKTLRHPRIEPAHPGDLLADIVIPATGKSKTEIAQLLGISRQSLYDILTRHQNVTPNVAVRLGKLFGNGAGFWLHMQQAFDICYFERELASELKNIKTLHAA